jgi:hypothetical protein
MQHFDLLSKNVQEARRNLIDAEEKNLPLKGEAVDFLSATLCKMEMMLMASEEFNHEYKQITGRHSVELEEEFDNMLRKNFKKEFKEAARVFVNGLPKFPKLQNPKRPTAPV